MPRISTQRPSVPWPWVGWITVPWLGLYYIDNVSDGGPLAFTIRRFVDSPVLIGLLSSIRVVFALLIGVIASYMSDRIWTRWGRRRPFLLVGWTGAAVAMAFLPFTSNLTTLILCVVVLQLFASIAKPLEPLYHEVIPPHQRGRAATLRNIAQQLFTLVFFGVLLAQFDDVHHVPLPGGRSWEFGGQVTLYWIGSGLLLAIVALLAFGVQEVRPPGPPPTERFTLRAFGRDVFGQRQWWMVYLLYATPILAGPGGGSFGVLMQTEQLGFTKAQVGWSVSIGTIVMILLVAPLAGYLTDRVSRMSLLRVGLLGPALVEFAFFLHLRYVADYRIALPVLIVFGTTAAALKTCAFLVWSPLIYDYVPTSRFGTVSAGLAFVGSVAPFITINLAGLWITGFTALFGRAGASTYDYSSTFVLQAICAALAFGLTLFFTREERRGRVVALGRLEAQAKVAPPAPA